MTEKKKKETPEAEVAETAEAEVVETVEKKEYDELNDRYLRLMAEFTNFKNRTMKEKSAMFGDGKASAIEGFLPLIDILELAAGQSSTDEAYKKGVLMIVDNFKNTLKNLGVEIIEETGVEFNPNIHNAVLTEVNEELPENTVSAVLQKGYKLSDKVLRPATVKVANS